MRRILLRVLLLLVAAGLVLGGVLVVWVWGVNEDLEAWREGPPPGPWASRLRQEALWKEQGLDRRVLHDYVPLERISQHLQLAVLVSEDIAFFGHGAVDARAVREALGEWWRGSRLRGASTITQQLARTLFLSPERSLGRKLDEARLAWWLERRLGKKRILELYLNVVEFGPGLLGAEAASRDYFDTSADVLDPEQAAGLAAALPSPGRDNPRTATERWDLRRQIILRRMQGAPWLRTLLEALTEGPENRTLPSEQVPSRSGPTPATPD